MQHVPVLLSETVEGLALRTDATVVDVTLGAGGHSREILSHLGSDGTLIALDADPTAVEANARLVEEGKQHKVTVHVRKSNFRKLGVVLAELGIEKIDALVADLGWRTEQFLEHTDGAAAKGFSFQNDEPLLMTFGDPKDYPFTARDIVNEWKQEDIANVLKGYGEERFARRIAKKIVEVRDETPITTTKALVEVIEGAVPGYYRRGKIHPATRTFQALRIAVNDELDALSELIHSGAEALSTKGRMAIISFHSIEDRIVKHTFRELARDHLGTVVTKKPITPTQEEITRNPRSRSAKLRIFEKA